MMYGNLVILLSLLHQLGIIECLPVSECERAVTYYSTVVHDCVLCPSGNPTKNCELENIEDMETCKHSCVVEILRITTPATSKEPEYEVATKSSTTLQHNRSKDAAGKRNGGHDKLLLTGIGVVVIGILPLGLLVHVYLKRNQFRHPTFAGYKLTGRENKQEIAPANV